MGKIDYIIDNNRYFLAKDIDGQEVFFDELQEIVLKIVLEIDRICRKHNIGYALAYGSALGLVNYHNFIPWDDDADIAINYDDLPRLIEALKEDLSADFSFDCYETCHRYNVLMPTMKVRYKNSFVKETNALTYPNRCRNGNGAFVDIITLMGVPESKKRHRLFILASEFIAPLYVFLNAFLRITPRFLQRHLKRKEKRIARKYHESKYISQTVIIPYQDFEKICHENRFPREVIYPFKEYDFAGHKLFSFNKPEEFVRLRYGDNSLKRFDGKKYYDTFPMIKRKNRHISEISLSKNKK